MNETIVEEGEVEILVHGDSRVNGIIARHYGSSADEYEVRSVKCTGKSTRNMWLVDIDLIRQLLKVKPLLDFEIYRRVNKGFANRVSFDYLILRKKPLTLRSLHLDRKEFPKEEGLTP